MVDGSLSLFKKTDEGEKKGGGFFKKEKSVESPVLPELASTINRLRVLEERYTNVQAELRVTESNMIKRGKRINTDVKTLTSDINELRKEVDEIKEKILLIVKAVQNCAKKEEVKVLQKYIDMWEPMNFVTHKEVGEIIDEKMREVLSQKR